MRVVLKGMYQVEVPQYLARFVSFIHIFIHFYPEF